jgi:hypothetical protein
LVKYKVKEMVRLIVDSHAADLVDKCEDYSREVLNIPDSRLFSAQLNSDNAVIWDIENATIITLNSKQEVTSATRGFDCLEKD